MEEERERCLRREAKTQARLGKPAMLKHRSEKTIVYDDGSFVFNKVIQGTFLSEHLTVDAEPPLRVETYEA